MRGLAWSAVSCASALMHGSESVLQRKTVYTWGLILHHRWMPMSSLTSACFAVQDSFHG